MDNPYIGYFASNPITVTNVSEYDSRHLITEMKSGQKVIIVGKLNGTKKINGQEFPIIEIHMARTSSSLEETAIAEGRDLDAKCKITNGPNGTVVIRKVSFPEKDNDPINCPVVKEVKNGLLFETYSYESVEGHYEDPENYWGWVEGEFSNVIYASDGSAWYLGTVYDQYGTYSGWVRVSDIGEKYVY